MAPEQRIRGDKLQQIRRRHFRDNPLCVACSAIGRVGAATELDHIIPLHKGGTNDASNLQGLCWDCHNVKTLKERGITEPLSRQPQGLDWL